MQIRNVDDCELRGKRVLIRVDLNVPMQAGRVTDATRIEQATPTICAVIAAGGQPILMSHLGRPEGRHDSAFSLLPLVAPLEAALNTTVLFAARCIGPPARAAIDSAPAGSAVLLENTRFHPGETANTAPFVQSLAELGDIFCNDAFSAAHRAHASTTGLAGALPACAGKLMAEELKALEAALGTPRHPVIAIVGGAKVSTKLGLLGNLVKRVDRLVIGGGMANTFLAAQGIDIGRSLAEREMVGQARSVLAAAAEAGCVILLPDDVVVASELKPRVARSIELVRNCPQEGMIVDLGPRTIGRIRAALADSATLVWNGPVGAFEIPPFDAGTTAIAREVARLTRSGCLLSVAGGGDTVAALNRAGMTGSLSHVSTAGGAFLEWMEGRELPGVAALMR